jgi:hypothetical protein
MRAMTLCLVLLLLAMAHSLPAADASRGASQALILTFSTRTISVSGASPGSSVVLFGVARESHHYYSEIVRRVELLADTDRDGMVALVLDRDIPPKAIWAAVDLSTGAFVVRPSPGYENAPFSLTDEQLKKDNNGQLKKMELPVSEVQLLLARPGVGAWYLSGAKNSLYDESNGVETGLRLDISRMIAVGSAPAAAVNFKKGDIIILVDPRWMRYASFEVRQ